MVKIVTDKEIIKALECCGKNHITGSTDACEHCFLQNSAMCVTELIYKALDLINRQQAEIEKHKNNCESCGAKTRVCIENLQNNIAEKQAEIERLQKHSKKVLETCSRVTKANDERNNDIFQGAIEVVRAEAIKEFAERLKLKVDIDLCEAIECSEYLYNLPKLIDNLVKEMVGEQG